MIASSTDKSLNIYSVAGTKLTPVRSYKLDAPAISMDLHNKSLALGLKNGNIEILQLVEGAKSVNVMNTHNEGEVWGLTAVTLADGSQRIVTSGDDNRLLAYNVGEHKSLTEGNVAVVKKGKKAKKAKKVKKAGASSMSNQPHEAQSRALAYNKQLNHLAVANNMGVVTIRSIDWQQVDSGDATSLNNVVGELFSKLAKEKRWIEIMRYSPCGKYLGVGDHN